MPEQSSHPYLPIVITAIESRGHLLRMRLVATRNLDSATAEFAIRDGVAPLSVLQNLKDAGVLGNSMERHAYRLLQLRDS